jgi:glycogen synthase
MKVLMLGWELPPHNSGGLGVACWQLCNALSKKGISIEFILPYMGTHKSDFMKIKYGPKDQKLLYGQYLANYNSLEFSDFLGEKSTNQTHTDYISNVARLAEQIEHDIIHAHDWLTFRAGLKAREISGKPLILHVHSIESDRAGGNKGNSIVREIESMAFMLADKVLAVSQHTKNAIMNDYNIPEEKIDVVHNSYEVNHSLISADNSYKYLQHMKNNGYKVVVNVGRLTIQKNIPVLLKAAKEVVYREPKTLFLIVGTGEQDYELIELAAQLGISQNVIFTGFLRGKKLRDAFAIGDLFVMPSISEPFGLTPIEATIYGTPSLVSKQSGVSEVLKNCLKVDFWDQNEMANQITNAVQNISLRQTLLQNVQAEVTQLSWSESADKVIGHYRNHNEAKI